MSSKILRLLVFPFKILLKKEFCLLLDIDKKEAEQLIIQKSGSRFLLNKCGPYLKIKINENSTFKIDVHFEFPLSILKFQHQIPYYVGKVEKNRSNYLKGHFFTRTFSKLNTLFFLLIGYIMLMFSSLAFIFANKPEAKVGCAFVAVFMFAWLLFVSKAIKTSNEKYTEIMANSISELFKKQSDLTNR